MYNNIKFQELNREEGFQELNSEEGRARILESIKSLLGIVSIFTILFVVWVIT